MQSGEITCAREYGPRNPYHDYSNLLMEIVLTKGDECLPLSILQQKYPLPRQNTPVDRQESPDA